jgi:hypothetical protein
MRPGKPESRKKDWLVGTLVSSCRLPGSRLRKVLQGRSGGLPNSDFTHSSNLAPSRAPDLQYFFEAAGQGAWETLCPTPDQGQQSSAPPQHSSSALTEVILRRMIKRADIYVVDPSHTCLTCSCAGGAPRIFVLPLMRAAMRLRDLHAGSLLLHAGAQLDGEFITQEDLLDFARRGGLGFES